MQVKVSYRMYLCSDTLPRSLGNLVGTVGEGDKPKTVKVGDGKELAGIYTFSPLCRYVHSTCTFALITYAFQQESSMV
jgi:hypothetical protein